MTRPDPLPDCTTDGAPTCTVAGLANGVAVTFSVGATFHLETSRRSP